MTTLDTLLDALEAQAGKPYLTQSNALFEAMVDALNGVGAGLVATSTTSATIGVGAQSLTVQADKNFSAGQFVIAYETATPTNFMVGIVSAYSGDTGVLAFTVPTGGTSGSGTIAAWTVAISGPRGATGASGGIAGGTLTADIDGDATYNLINLPAPASEGAAARKSYVDDAILRGRWRSAFGA